MKTFLLLLCMGSCLLADAHTLEGITISILPHPNTGMNTLTAVSEPGKLWRRVANQLLFCWYWSFLQQHHASGSR
jgi:hypothetical protein